MRQDSISVGGREGRDAAAQAADGLPMTAEEISDFEKNRDALITILWHAIFGRTAGNAEGPGVGRAYVPDIRVGSHAQRR